MRARRLGLLRFGGSRAGFLVRRIVVLGGLLEFLDRLTEALRKRRQLRAAKQKEDDQEDDHQFSSSKAEGCENGCGKHRSKLSGLRGLASGF